jgi:hypothetical protein
MEKEVGGRKHGCGVVTSESRKGMTKTEGQNTKTLRVGIDFSADGGVLDIPGS